MPTTTTTGALAPHAPLELLGFHDGVTVIDPSTILARLWYFDGKFLRAEGFRRDQQYVRSLVALTNQVAGHGVVHGFDARLGTGDTIDVDGGLASAPSGRILYLPQATTLSIAQLISRASGEFDPGAMPNEGTASFAPCPPTNPAGPDQSLTPNSHWLLTVSSAEALCGEEERFGQLCEDACATETDRSLAIEGVTFRVRPLSLTLPSSSVVTLTGRHERNRVATAYFERERQAIASGISGAGIRSALWCAGAEGVGSEEVALGVFNRSGSITTWLDMWTARREVMETTPQRYWGWRFAMRPLDVFLAQVLQFQCQLLGVADDGPVGGEDPCREERETLQAANDLIASLIDGASTPAAEEPVDTVTVTATGLPGAGSAAAIAQLNELSTLITSTLSGHAATASGSVLIDHGFVTISSAGYLPVDANHDVAAQVQAFMGPGVDLRFCAVRPDFIPEALLEAQHMERISLTQGIDDPDMIEEVDVLVPNGSITNAEPRTNALVGELDILPNLLGKGEDFLSVPVIAREHSSGGAWSWAMAGVANLGSDFDGLLASSVATTHVANTVSEEAEEQPIAESDLNALRSALRERETREGRVRRVFNRRRATAVDFGIAPGLGSFRSPGGFATGGPDRDGDGIVNLPTAEEIAAAETVRIDRGNLADVLARRDSAAGPGSFVANPDPADRIAGFWIDIEVATSLTSLGQGDSTEASGRLVGFVDIDATNDGLGELLADIRFNGNLRVVDRQSVVVDGMPAVRIQTAVDGFLEGLIDQPNQDDDPGTISTNGFAIEWTFAEQPGQQLLAMRPIVMQSDFSGVIELRFRDSGSPRTIESRLVAGRPQSTHGPRTWADLTMTNTPGALDSGSFGRQIGETSIAVIGAALAVRGRDLGFAATAPGRLLSSDPGSMTGSISGPADWVMFHRRRTKVCSEATVVAPTALRRYDWHHATVDQESAALIKDVQVLLESGASSDQLGAVLSLLDFELVTSVEFERDSSMLHSSALALRADWRAEVDDDVLHAALVADGPAGDGLTVALGRLSSAVSSIAAVTDTSGAQTRVLGAVPAEFQSAGVDGVFLSVGTESPEEVTTNCARIYRMSFAAFEIVKAVTEGLAFHQLEDRLEEAGHQVDVFVAVFEGAEITNRDAVSTWFDDRGFSETRFALSSALMVPGMASEREVWLNERVPIVVERLQGATTPSESLGLGLDLGTCGAAVFLLTDDL